MQKRRTKVLGLVHGDFTSHTVRVLAIAKALRETGEYDILFSGSGPYMKFVGEAGFTWVETKTISGEDYIRMSEKDNIFGLYNKENVEYLISVEDALQKEHRPDIIIRDFMREGAGIAAKVNGIYDVLLEQVNLGPNFKFDFLPMNMSWIGDKKNVDIERLVNSIRKNLSKHFHNKLKQLGIEPTDITVEGVEADLILIPDSEVLFGSDLISEKYKYIGPILVLGQQQEPEWKQEFENSKKKKLVITGGTTGRWDHTQLYVQAFNPEEFTVALYTNTDKIPKGFYGGKFEISSMIKSADVFINHGGLGSVYLGLVSGTPMICLYNDSEQQATAMRYSRLQAGNAYCSRDITAQLLKQTVDNLMNNPKIKERAVDISKKIDITTFSDLSVKYIKEGFERFLSMKNK